MEKKHYVAIIDDDHDDSTLLKECFAKLHSLSVRCFNRGSSFFDFINNNEHVDFCLIIVDLNLPESSGVEIVKKIRQSPFLETIPVLVFTTGGTPAEKDFCEKQKIEIFRKPNSLKEWESIAFLMALHCDPRLMKEYNF